MAESLHGYETTQNGSQHNWRNTSRDGPPVNTNATYFQQSCPACGRRLLILVEYLGTNVRCRHCRRGFVARDCRDAAEHRGAAGDASDSVLERADRLLAALERPSRRRRIGKL
jgi:hypothetical protein